MDQKQYDAGMKVRREVLGDEHVDKSMASVDALTKPLQDLVVEYGWGATWARPGHGQNNTQKPDHEGDWSVSVGPEGFSRCRSLGKGHGEWSAVKRLNGRE
jgi:hypothetical protein